MKKVSLKIIQITLLLIVFFSLFSTTAYALDKYTILAPLPGISEPCTTDPVTKQEVCKTTLPTYLPAAFKMGIAIAAGMAFVVITIGGITYATSDAIQGKSQGREWIENAIWGLLLVVGAYVILYTINPKILTFDFSIEKPKITSSTPTITTGGPTTGGTATGGVGCQGNCPYTYVNQGATINYRDCSNCKDAESFGLSIETKVINGQKAQMNEVIGDKLKAVKDTTNSPSFSITETWPPTVNHASQDQYDGTSVDLKLSAPSAATINAFMAAADKQGLRVVYEVQTEKERQAYIAAGVRSASIIALARITGQHFSVYLR